MTRENELKLEITTSASEASTQEYSETESVGARVARDYDTRVAIDRTLSASSWEFGASV